MEWHQDSQPETFATSTWRISPMDESIESLPRVWQPINSSMSPRQGNILDEIHDTLAPEVWDHPGAPEPKLRPGLAQFIRQTIYTALERNGYRDPHTWLTLVLTGSLTTYQYGPTSDCDVSLFVNSEHLPEWSRAEMIGIMVGECDGHKLPGTPYPLQCFVVARRIHQGDLYRPGLRSGYDIDQERWIVPPDRGRSHSVEQQENGFYTYALESADKMERLLRYEPDKAVRYFDAIRRRRREDQAMGKGDFSQSNIVYKFLEKRGLTPALEQMSPSWIPHAQFRSQAIQRTGGSLIRSSAFHKIIHHTEARGNSRPVSLAEFQRLAEEGRHRYQTMLQNRRGTPGLDANWDGIKQRTYHEILKPWGGATIDPHTGQALPQGADLYALTARPPGMQPISLPEHPSPEEWHAAMDAARQAYEGILDREGHHLGVFHDDDLKRVDIDPTIIVDNPHDVETIGAYTRNVGGAYHFLDGMGYFPPHVDPEEDPDPMSREAAISPYQQVLDNNAGQDLRGLPGPVNVPSMGPLQFHSNADIQRVANEYNSSQGLGAHPTDYLPVNPQLATQVAQAYEAMPHSPQDPQTQQAYSALAQESMAQYQHAVNNGYRFEFYPEQDPYPNSPREAVMDLHRNKHMYVYPTSVGYGAGDQAMDHPLLQDSGVRWGGQPVLYNDIFRAVHDFYGHAKEGLGFRHHGEDNAFRQHSAMFSPLAQRALAAETRGQNSWVNFGPYGQQNQTAKQGETVYAPQKAGLLPEWASDPELHRHAVTSEAWQAPA